MVDEVHLQVPGFPDIPRNAPGGEAGAVGVGGGAGGLGARGAALAQAPLHTLQGGDADGLQEGLGRGLEGQVAVEDQLLGVGEQVGLEALGTGPVVSLVEPLHDPGHIGPVGAAPFPGAGLALAGVPQVARDGLAVQAGDLLERVQDPPLLGLGGLAVGGLLTLEHLVACVDVQVVCGHGLPSVTLSVEGTIRLR